MLLVYCATFFENCGNYKSHGDTKFIPECGKELFWKFVTVSEFYKTKEGKEKCEFIWENVVVEMFNYLPPYRQITFPDCEGQSPYYS